MKHVWPGCVACKAALQKIGSRRRAAVWEPTPMRQPCPPCALCARKDATYVRTGQCMRPLPAYGDTPISPMGEMISIGINIIPCLSLCCATYCVQTLCRRRCPSRTSSSSCCCRRPRHNSSCSNSSSTILGGPRSNLQVPWSQAGTPPVEWNGVRSRRQRKGWGEGWPCAYGSLEAGIWGRLTNAKTDHRMCFLWRSDLHCVFVCPDMHMVVLIL